jgi:branched-chain amino acid transport system substrate-binding protein
MVRPLVLLAGIIVIVIAVLAGYNFLQAKNHSSTDEVVRIGIYQPLTGRNALNGRLELAGIQLAHELYPTVRLGDKTFPVELIFADNRSDMLEASIVVERLISHDRVHMILGTWGSSLAIPGGEILRDRIPGIALSVTHPLVTLGNPWYFRICFTDYFQGAAMAQYAYKDLGARTAVLVQDFTNDYSVGLVRVFADSFRQITGNPNSILSTLNYNSGDVEFSSQVTHIRSINPDIVFAPGNFFESALIIRQARDIGIRAPFLGGDTWEIPEFITTGGGRIDGAFFPSMFVPEFSGDHISQKFINEYRSRNNREPAAVSALGFDGYKIALEAITRSASLDPNALRYALERTDFTGATGRTIFNEDGDAIKGAFIKEVANSQFVFRGFVGL